MITTLEKLRRGQRAIVKEINGGQAMRRRLWAMGLHAGDVIDVVRAGVFAGPVLLQVNGMELAIGHSQACRIEVEVADSR